MIGGIIGGVLLFLMGMYIFYTVSEIVKKLIARKRSMRDNIDFVERR